MAVIRKIGVLSLAKFEAVLMAIFGLVFGIMIAMFSTAIGSATGYGLFGAGLGLFAIIGLPIFYGVFGFLSGAIGALIYNLVAHWVGGIELDLSK